MGFLFYSFAAVFLVALWRLSSVSRYWIKFFTYGLVSLGICLLIPFWFFRPKDSHNALFPSWIFRQCCRFWGLKYNIEGQENIVRNSGCVILINHQSIIDLLVLCHLWPLIPNCTVVSKKELLYFGPVGLAAWLCGALFIDRTKSNDAQVTINRTGDIIRNQKRRVLLFPEGTRNSNSKLLPFKKGAFHLALSSKCPIQPIVVSRYTFLGSQKFENGEVKIKILKPIPTENLSSEDIPQLVDQTYTLMSEEVDHISSKL